MDGITTLMDMNKLGVGDGHRSLACCSPWGGRESDTTERLNRLTKLLVHVLFTWNGTSIRDFSYPGVIFITLKNHFGNKLGDRLTSRMYVFLKIGETIKKKFL